ncbi:DUF4232 domain-containing protein [Kribbella sp. NBC_00709]|uniref:DUF4232 domain-containing protein n=1 Tax=Kribbella sp. NBC_00709 TaxID=2975972 RepID=UPI002E2A1FA1|nr:DUF4232 domain-containing protein [Kribbella sp. NBC_00709]
MHRRARVGLLAGLLLLTACGTQSAAVTTGSRPSLTQLTPRPLGPTPFTTAHPDPTPAPPRPTCPASGASITVGPVDAALGHRAVVIKLTNCRSTPITVDGYPDIAVLDPGRRAMNVTVTRGTSYMAIDPGPAKLLLRKGETAVAAISWSNTVEAGEDKASGTYVAVARGKGEHAVVWPVDTDLGSTAKITLTAWCRTFPT